MANDNEDHNLDQISMEPGLHPAGTLFGAVAGGATVGVAAGALAGPVGAAAGAVAGAVVGALYGKAAAEGFDPTAEEAYWQFAYAKEAYYEQGRVYADYAPAYRMGMYARGQYQGSFDDAEPDLSSNWESSREASTLDWPSARPASRAAWDRVELASRNSAASVSRMAASSVITGTSGDTIGGNNVTDTLYDLLECSRDGEYGFRECAELASSGEIKNLMGQRANQCEESARELQTLILHYGGEADSGGTVSGAMHRGWVSLRGMLSGHSDYAMLEECERGEDSALERYRKALKENLPADVRAVVVRQCEGVQRNHNDIKARRDAVRVSS